MLLLCPVSKWHKDILFESFLRFESGFSRPPGSFSRHCNVHSLHRFINQNSLSNSLCSLWSVTKLLVTGRYETEAVMDRPVRTVESS